MLLPFDISYSDKRSSSGRLYQGRIVLVIGCRLPKDVQRAHIDKLHDALQRRADNLLTLPLPLSGQVVDTLERLERLTDDINDRYYGLEYATVDFRKQDTRWGSCSIRTRRLHISRRLMGAPEDLVAYVVTHELCHLRHPNHGQSFWALVAHGCPDYRKRRRQLEAWELRRYMAIAAMAGRGS